MNDVPREERREAEPRHLTELTARYIGWPLSLASDKYRTFSREKFDTMLIAPNSGSMEY